MEQDGIDAVIIFQNKDLYYFSGTTQNCVLAVTGNDALLFVMRNAERAAGETFIERTIKMKSTSEIKNFISAKKIGIEEDVLPVSMYRRLIQMFPSSQFCDISQTVREIRAVKDENEIKLLKRSASINDAGHGKAREVLHEGMTELELSAAISNEMRRLGDDWAVRSRHWNSLPPTQIASGKNSCVANRSFIALGGVGLSAANPCGPSARKIKKGEPVYVDLVPSYMGYATDETRTFCIGKPGEEVTAAYDACVEIYNALLDRMEVGVPVRELYQSSLAMAKEHGYENNFLGVGEYRVKFIGHGIGLELDELPVLADNDARLEENMILTIEPKIVTSEGGVGIEDTILITKKGAKTLTNADRGMGV